MEVWSRSFGACLRSLAAGVLFLTCGIASATVADDRLALKVVGFQTTTGGNGWRYATVAVRFSNLTDKALPIALNAAKSGLTDERGNRYAVVDVRGIGEVRGTTVDPKFVLGGHQSSEALLQLRWRPATKGVIFGVKFDLDVTVSEIESLSGGQIKVGREHVLSAKALETNDLLTGSAQNDAGPFTAQVADTKITWSPDHKMETVTVVLDIKNTSDKQLILGYQRGSSLGIDDQSSSFAPSRPGTVDNSFSGIGPVGGGKADPQFSLAPGESRQARFSVTRFVNAVQGSKLLFCTALVQLEVLPGDQIREVRQYSLSFSGVPIKG